MMMKLFQTLILTVNSFMADPVTNTKTAPAIMEATESTVMDHDIKVFNLTRTITSQSSDSQPRSIWCA